MITRYITLAWVVLLLGTLTTIAQSKSSYNGTIGVTPVRVLQAGETLHVEMDFILDHVKVRVGWGRGFDPASGVINRHAGASPRFTKRA